MKDVKLLLSNPEESFHQTQAGPGAHTGKAHRDEGRERTPGLAKITEQILAGRVLLVYSIILDWIYIR